MYDLMDKYLSARKNTYSLMITAAAVGFLLVLLLKERFDLSSLLFPIAFVLLFMLCECQARLSEKKRAVIREATRRIAHKFELQCADPRLWDEKQCRAALFFDSDVNAFYLERSIPHQVFTQEKQGVILQHSHVSFGGFGSKAVKVGKHYVVSGKPTSYIISSGLLFRCILPFHFSDSWIILPRKWGRHQEKSPLRTILFSRLFNRNQTPQNFRLFKNENETLWIYSTASPEQCSAAGEYSLVALCYAPLRGKSRCLMSFTGNTMYLFIPFDWKITSEQELQDCIAEYQANLELVRKIVFDDILPYHYEKQFAAIHVE